MLRLLRGSCSSDRVVVTPGIKHVQHENKGDPHALPRLVAGVSVSGRAVNITWLVSLENESGLTSAFACEVDASRYLPTHGLNTFSVYTVLLIRSHQGKSGM